MKEIVTSMDSHYDILSDLVPGFQIYLVYFACKFIRSFHARDKSSGHSCLIITSSRKPESLDTLSTSSLYTGESLVANSKQALGKGDGKRAKGT